MKKELLQKALNPQQSYPVIEQDILQEQIPPPPKQPMPNEFIMNPLLSVYTSVDDLSLDVNDLANEVKKTGKYIAENNSLLRGILKELQDRRPKGKVVRVNQTAPDKPSPPAFPSGFFIVDANKYLGEDGMRWRSYVVFNPGPNNLYVGFNVGLSPQVDVSSEDLAKDDKFDFLTPGQLTRDSFDTEEIYSLHIRADPATGKGPSPFRAKLNL